MSFMSSRRAFEHYPVGVFPAPLLVQVLPREELRESDDGVERRAQLVRHHREESGLGLRVAFGGRGGLVRAARLPLQ